MDVQQQIVREARSWLGTPYLLGAQLKMVGADCATLLLAVYRACGLIGDEEIGIFSGDWYHHAVAQLYMLKVLRHAYKVAEVSCYRVLRAAEAGDIALVRAFGARLYNHGGIVTGWPMVVDAVDPRVREIDASLDPLWSNQQVIVFRAKALVEVAA